MSTRRAPTWLADFQADFGALLRTPLCRSTGTLRTDPTAYDQPLVKEVLTGPFISADEGLAVYNRQYWFRLFSVLQFEYPLTARLLGYWLFNDYAARFILARAPRSFDISCVADGFDTFLSSVLPTPLPTIGTPGATLPTEAVLTAVVIDAAFRQALLEPEQQAFRPSSQDAQRLLRSRLRPRVGWTLVVESWPLLTLRSELASLPGLSRVALPARLLTAQYWAIFCSPSGIGQLALAPRQAHLFQLLSQHCVSEALALLEKQCSAAERHELPAWVQKWLAQSIELGFWRALEN